MPKRKVKNISTNPMPVKTKKEDFLKKFKFTESYTSLILGAVVVLVVGILVFSFASGNKNGQTSSTSETGVGNSEDLMTDGSKTSSTYTIKPGDDLWSISEDVYNDGYKWIEIAKTNKLDNPGLIHAGNKLTIPKIEEKEMTAITADVSPELKETVIMAKDSIKGNFYTVKKGDNLWDICVRAYGDGYKWPEVARTNNLTNPDLIFSDSVLQLPR